MSAALPMHESNRETRASQEREKDQRDWREGRSAPGSEPSPAAGKGWWDIGSYGNRSVSKS